jgi:hypothetical protein
MATRTRDLTDQVNGVAVTFSTFEDYLPGTLEVYLNGVRQRPGLFFSETGAQSFTTSEAPRVGDSLSAQFEVEGPGDVLIFPMVVPAGIDPSRS